MKKTGVFKTVTVAVVLLLVGAYLVIEKKKELASLPVAPSHPVAVTTVPAEKGRLGVTSDYLGLVRPVREATLSTRVSGHVVGLEKYEGDPVRQGEVLVSIDDRQIRASLTSLRAELAAAMVDLEARRSVFERNERLIEHEAVSQEAFDLSKSAYSAARARVASLKAQIAATKADLDYTVVEAPFSGVVSARFKNPGDFVTPGSPIISIQDRDAGYRILVKVPQEKAGLFKEGGNAWMEWRGTRIATLIHKVHPAVDESGLATVELRLPSVPYGLPAGSAVTVTLLEREVQGILLPVAALVEGEEDSVYVVRDGRIFLQKVKVLAKVGDEMAVEAPIQAGEPVVVADPGLLLRLHPGQKVSVQQR